MHSLKPREPAVLIRYLPDDRPDPEVWARVKAAVQRANEPSRAAIRSAISQK